jgi:hypothetical protein
LEVGLGLLELRLCGVELLLHAGCLQLLLQCLVLAAEAVRSVGLGLEITVEALMISFCFLGFGLCDCKLLFKFCFSARGGLRWCFEDLARSHLR